MEEQIKRKSFKEEEKVINKVLKDMLSVLSIEESFEVKEEGDGVEILLDTKDNGILIGYHGEVLESLQLLTSLAIAKKLGYFIRVSIEIGEYKRNRVGFLENMAFSAKERALTQDHEVSLPNLKAWERRHVHMLFQDDEEVMSESIGEGRDRTLVIKKR